MTPADMQFLHALMCGLSFVHRPFEPKVEMIRTHDGMRLRPAQEAR